MTSGEYIVKRWATNNSEVMLIPYGVLVELAKMIDLEIQSRISHQKDDKEPCTC